MAATEQEYEDMVRRMADELNDENVDVLDDVLAPDHVTHRPGYPDGEDELDREGVKAMAAAHREGENSSAETVTAVFVDTDRNQIRTQSKLIQRNEEGEFRVSINRVHRVEDGRIAETWAIPVPTDVPEE